MQDPCIWPSLLKLHPTVIISGVLVFFPVTLDCFRHLLAGLLKPLRFSVVEVFQNPLNLALAP